jgi:hypothetical protein
MKTVSELFSAGDFMFETILLVSKDNHSFAQYNMKGGLIAMLNISYKLKST